MNLFHIHNFDIYALNESFLCNLRVPAKDWHSLALINILPERWIVSLNLAAGNVITEMVSDVMAEKTWLMGAYGKENRE